MVNQVRFQSFKDKLRAYAKYAAAIFAIILAISLIRNIISTRASIKTIEKKEEEVKALEEEQKELKDKLNAVSTDSFTEKQIRDQLGLSKPGEIVLVLPDDQTLKNLVPDMPEEEGELPPPNWKKWVNLFTN